MPSNYFSCIVPGCENNSKINPQQSFFHVPKTVNILEKWARNLNLPDIVHKRESTRLHYKVCRMHFDDSCFQTSEKKKLNRGVVPTIFNVIEEIDVREFVKGAIPSLFDNDTIAKSKESPEPLRSNENDLETKPDKIIEDSEVTPAPILFVSSSVNYKQEEELLTTRNKQADTDCDPLRKRIVRNPRYTDQCNVEDLESSIKRERNWNLAMNEISELRKKVNILQTQNRRLDRRVMSMKTLLRHFKKTHHR